MTEIAPGIVALPALHPAEAATIVAALQRCSTWRAAGINADRSIDRRVRDADLLEESDEPALIALLRDRLFGATAALAARLAQRTVLAEIQIVRYTPGGRYADHRDSPARRATPRALSLVCYLNDDFTGGATTFIEPAISVMPQTGIVVAFAPDLLHRAEPVRSGTKIVVTAWYHVSRHRSG